MSSPTFLLIATPTPSTPSTTSVTQPHTLLNWGAFLVLLQSRQCLSHLLCAYSMRVTQNLTDRFYTMSRTQSSSSLRGVAVYRQSVSGCFYTLGSRILHVIERCWSFQNKRTTTPCRLIIKLPSEEVWKLMIWECNIQNGARSSFLWLPPSPDTTCCTFPPRPKSSGPETNKKPAVF